MRRLWIGIRASAVLAILGSVATLFLGGVMVWAVFHAPPRRAVVPPVPLKAMSAAMAVMSAGLGAWGIWTAVGIFRRRGWARVSILIFAVLLAFMGCGAMLAVFFVPLPSAEGVPTPLMGNIRWMITAFYGGLALIGAWWLFLFNTSGAKQYFAEREFPRESARPLSIGIIGWYLLIGAVFTALAAVLRMPAMLFGMAATGWSALAVYTGFTAVQIYLGAGLLQLQEEARVWSIAYFCVAGANVAVTVALPDFAGRMQDMFSALPGFLRLGPPPPLEGTGRLMLISAAVVAVPIWFLVRRRAAFVKTPPPS